VNQKTLIVGLGNPILGDDGLGWEAISRLEERNLGAGVELDSVALGGLALMERIIGYENVIIIDAMNSEQYPVGCVMVFDIAELPNPLTGHLGSAHDASLQEALRMGRELGADVPDRILIIAVETPNVYDFSELLTEVADKAVMEVVEKVQYLLQNNFTVPTQELHIL
jgi:hydrogenase maturation protease